MIDNKKSPKQYYHMLHLKRETELFLSALRGDIFSSLEEWENAYTLSVKTSFNERNLSFYLNALASIGLLEKDNDSYRNTLESNLYLNKKSEVYMGECLLFREKMMSFERLDEQILQGPNSIIEEKNNGVEVYDFYEAARVGIPEMYTGRVQALTMAAKKLFKNYPPRKFLDLGGGSGCFVIELVKAFKDSKGVVFEHSNVAPLPRKVIEERGLSDRIQVTEGNFNTDEIGEGYDLIIASGILDFAKEHLDELLDKLAKALSPNGYLYIVTNDVSEDYQNPPEAILGWLSSHLDGLDLLLTKKLIDEALDRHGFLCIQNEDVGGMFQGLPGRFYQVRQEEDSQYD